MLTDAEVERYARQLVLREVGGRGQARFAGARVVVVGVGGIGCPAAQALAGAGVGQLVLVDRDRVERSNLPRQTLFEEADLGVSKAAAAAVRLRARNAHVAVEPRELAVDAGTVDALIAGADVVLDGCDNFATRLVVSDATVRARVPLVSAAVGRWQGQWGTFCGWEADAPCYRCFVGDAFDAEDCDGCAELGVLGPLPAIVGGWGALEVLRALHPFGSAEAGRVQVLDALTGEQRAFRIPKDPTCRGCGAGASKRDLGPGPE